MHSLRLLVLAAILATLGVSCSSGHGTSGGNTTTTGPATSTTVGQADVALVAALTRQIQYLTHGQYGPAWEQLHPAQQAVVPKALYVRCNAQTAIALVAQSIIVVRDLPDQIVVPGTNQRVDARSLTVAIKTPTGTQQATFHLILVGASWRFVLSLTGAGAAAYRRGACPPSG